MAGSLQIAAEPTGGTWARRTMKTGLASTPTPTVARLADLILYELSPFAEPRLLDSFYDPDAIGH